MRLAVWMVIIASAVAIAYLCWRAYLNWEARKRSAEERFAAFMAETAKAARPAAPIAATAPAAVSGPAVAAAGAARSMAQEKLLFEAASKAAEAGEHALSIQLYARLLARFPATAFAEQVRADVEAQKRRLAKR